MARSTRDAGKTARLVAVNLDESSIARGSSDVEHFRFELERRMLYATDDAEQWAAGRERVPAGTREWPRLLRAAQ